MQEKFLPNVECSDRCLNACQRIHRNDRGRCMGTGRRHMPATGLETIYVVGARHELLGCQLNQLTHLRWSANVGIECEWNVQCCVKIPTLGKFSMTPNRSSELRPFGTNGSKCSRSRLMPNRETPGILAISSSASSFSLVKVNVV